MTAQFLVILTMVSMVVFPALFWVALMIADLSVK